MAMHAGNLTGSQKVNVMIYVLAEALYERDWEGRRWNSEEQLRSRPTFAQLLTGETALVQPWPGGTDFGVYEREEAQRRLLEAKLMLAKIVTPII